MHPTIRYHLAKAYMADLRRQGQRDTLASATRRARWNHLPGGGPQGLKGQAGPHTRASRPSGTPQ